MNNTPLKTLLLGKTGLTVTKPAMGCLPLQRCSVEDAVRLLQAAYEGGIRYFDTANAYTDSEKKIGLALSDVRKNIVLSTKSHARDKAGVLAHIENSLKMMRFATSDLQAIAWMLQNSVSLRVISKPASFRSAIFPTSGIADCRKSAKRQEWDLLP